MVRIFSWTLALLEISRSRAKFMCRQILTALTTFNDSLFFNRETDSRHPPKHLSSFCVHLKVPWILNSSCPPSRSPNISNSSRLVLKTEDLIFIGMDMWKTTNNFRNLQATTNHMKSSKNLMLARKKIRVRDVRLDPKLLPYLRIFFQL